MALIGNSLTYRGKETLSLDQVLPGVAFHSNRTTELDLQPHFDGKLWHVPVITGWAVEAKLNAKSYTGAVEVPGIGAYQRRFMLCGKKQVIADYDQFGSHTIYAELGQDVAWGLGVETAGELPQLEQEWSEIGMALWIVKRLYFVFSFKQIHEVVATDAGYFYPSGDIVYDITYQWRTLSVADFQKIKSRM